jgi:hypothetical protein
MNPISSLINDSLHEPARLYDLNAQIARDQQAAKTPDPVSDPEQGAPARSSDGSTDDGAGAGDRWLPRDGQQNADDGTYTRQALSYSSLRQETEMAGTTSLTPEEADQVERLRNRDSEVHQHEQAHAGALGTYAGAIAYMYQIGPDGKAYAIGGSTEVKPPTGKDPAQQAAWGRTVRNAAFAAGDASAADVAVAADATRAQLAAYPGFSVIA